MASLLDAVLSPLAFLQGEVAQIDDPISGATGGLVEPLALVDELLGLPRDTLEQVLSAVGAGDLVSIEPPAGSAFQTTDITLAPKAGRVDLSGFSRGNGRTANRTIVETLDLATGKIIRRRVLPGTPHMMNSDIIAAKKVFRQSAKLHARMPRRPVKESEVTKLKNAAVQAAIANVTCPPPPCK